MDHFNSTIKDGKLVNTRRGLQVSRQKFNGISFVNTSAQDPTPSGPDNFTTTDASRPFLRQVKFVEKGNEPRQGTEISFVSDSGQGRKPRRRANPREQRLPTSPGCSSRRSSRSSSLTPSGGDASGQHGALLGPQANFAIDPRIMGSPVSSPSAWTTQETLSDDEWKLFHHYYAQVPHQTYPYENILAYNPIGGDDFYSMVTSDIASLHCVLMRGTIAEAIVNSETDPKGFAYHISKICSILNRKLDQNHAADVVTLQCIASLARMGCYVGRLDHWHMHMRGLQKLLDVNGGLGGLPSWLLEMIHTADLKGAAALATTPYLTFQRRYDSISTILPLDVREYACGKLIGLLRPLRVNQEVIDVLSSLAAFASVVRLAGHSGGNVKFDPQVFTEDWQAIMHTLITRPAPLRESSSDSCSANPYFSGIPTITTAVTSSGSTSSTTTENYTTNHRLRHSIPIIPTLANNHIEPALRIAALLFLKELLPDWPRNLGGYAVLLSLLRQHLQAIITQFGTNNFDPLLSRPLSPEPTELKPVLIFLAVMGNISSLFADENEGRIVEGDRYDRTVYRDCLRKVASLTDGQKPNDEELFMVRLFDLRDVLSGKRKGQERQGGWEEIWGLLEG
ncbi:hypothetical protein QBC43DRAFT_199601 [Cladorrhinum sp. PSN259]|nr:hypothetical protein QBC43DRAFT_199601 [Cladorrhinum sp. PSN259]